MTLVSMDPHLRTALAQGFAASPHADNHSRKAAFDRFMAAGLPNATREDWRFTNLPQAAVMGRATPLGPVDLASSTLADLLLDAPSRLVFVNGRLDHSLSHAAVGVAFADQGAEALLGWGLDRVVQTPDRALIALNGAMAADAVTLTIAPQADAGLLQILFITLGDQDGSAHARLWVDVGANARATLMEQHIALGSGGHWSNPVIVGALGQGASLDHARLQDLGPVALQTAYAYWAVGRDASYRHVSLAMGAMMARHELSLRQAGEGANIDVAGLSLARGSALLDHTLRLYHDRPYGTSQQLFKQVVDGDAHTVFQGRIHVAPGARGTNAEQLSRSLLLSKNAQADAKPELEILNDDVRCSHGATVGDLDRNALFYMQSRGINAEQARALLVHAFAQEVTDRIALPSLRRVFEARLSQWLEAVA